MRIFSLLFDILLVVWWIAGISTVVPALLAWVDRLNTPEPPEERLAPGISGFIGVLWEWGASFVCYLSLVTGLRNGDPEPDPAEVSDPVLFVHGYGMNRGIWWYMRRRFTRAGYRNLFTINLPAFNPGIATLVDMVALRVESLSQVSGGRAVVLVGHSMGGVISRLVAERLDPDRVALVYSIGSPHAGTSAAVLGLGRQARDMRPLGEFVSSLPTTAPTSVPMVTVASRFDNLIIPWRSALLEGATPQVFEYLGHNALLVSRDVADFLVGDLAARRLAA